MAGMTIGLATELAECEMELYVMEIDGKDDSNQYSDVKKRLERAQKECMSLGQHCMTSMQQPHTKDN